MSDFRLSSLLLSLQHHEQSLHGIERHLINHIERAEAEGLIPDEKLRAFSSALEQLLSIRTSFHDRLSDLSDSLSSEEQQTTPLQAPSRQEERVETYAPFQTSPGLTPSAALTPLTQPQLGTDETPVLEGSGQGEELLGEAPTLEPTQSQFSLTQPSVKLQEALSKGTTSLDDRLPNPQPAFDDQHISADKLPESASPQPSVLPPLMHTPLPEGLGGDQLVNEPITGYEPTPTPLDRSEALTLTEGELKGEEPEPSLEEHQARADNPYITYVPPTPEPVVSEESGGHFEPISELNFSGDPRAALDDLDLEDLERSLDQLGAGELEVGGGLPSLGGAGSQAQEASVKRPPRVALGVRVDVASDVVRFEAMGHDISTGGIFIETDTPLEPGEQLRLRFELDRTAFVVEVNAQVRWCRLAKDAGPDRPMGGGLRFLNLSEQASAELAAFTAERLGGGI